MEEPLIDTSLETASLPSSSLPNMLGDEGILVQIPPFCNTKSNCQSPPESKEMSQSSLKLYVKKSSKTLTTKVVSGANDNCVILKKKCVIPKNSSNVKSQKNVSMSHLIQLLKNFEEVDILNALKQRKSSLENNSKIRNQNLSISFSSVKKANDKDTNLVNNAKKRKSYEQFNTKIKKNTSTNLAASKKITSISENNTQNLNKTFISNVSSKKNNRIIQKSNRQMTDIHSNQQKDKKTSSLLPLNQSFLPDHSISSLFETPSTSSSSLAHKSVTTVLQTESDQSQSITTRLQKLKTKEGKETEKQWQHQRKVNELTIQLNQLEKKVSNLKSENESLKKHSEEQKSLDEKLKILKKRNADLNHTIKKLEEAAKKSLKCKESNNDVNIKKTNTKHPDEKQLQQHLHENAKLQHFHVKYQQLVDHLNSLNTQQNLEIDSSEGSLDHVIRVANKERIVLERDNKMLIEELDFMKQRCVVLEGKIEEHTEAVKEKDSMEMEVMKGRIKLESLQQTLDKYQQSIAQMEEEKSELTECNRKLSISNKNLNTQLQTTQKLQEEKGRLMDEVETQCLEHMQLIATLAQLNSSLDAAKTHNTTQDQLLSEWQERATVSEKEASNLHKRLQEVSQTNEEEKKVLQLTNHQLEKQLELIEKTQKDLKEENMTLREAIKRQQTNNKNNNNKNNNKNGRKGRNIDEVKCEEDDEKSMDRSDDSEEEVTTISKTSNIYAKHERSKAYNDKSFNGVLALDKTLHKKSVRNERLDKELSEEVCGSGEVVDDHGGNEHVGRKCDEEIITNGGGMDRRGVDGEINKDEKLNVEEEDVSRKVLVKNWEEFDDETEDLITQQPQLDVILSDGDGGEVRGMESKEQFDFEGSEDLHIFQALYNYDPSEYSPNLESSEELYLSQGDYVIVYGGMDEDGFYYGENMEGLKGYIPSNFVRKLSEGEKDEFQRMVSMVTPPSFNHMPDILVDESPPSTTKEDLNLNPLSKTLSLSDQTSQEELPEAPIGLNVDVDEDSNSLLITWLPVTLAGGLSGGMLVMGYCVYLDGLEVNVVKGASEDHLRLTGLDERFLSSAHIITLTTISTNHIESRQSAPFLLNHIKKPITTTTTTTTHLTSDPNTINANNTEAIPANDLNASVITTVSNSVINTESSSTHPTTNTASNIIPNHIKSWDFNEITHNTSVLHINSSNMDIEEDGTANDINNNSICVNQKSGGSLFESSTDVTKIKTQRQVCTTTMTVSNNPNKLPSTVAPKNAFNCQNDDNDDYDEKDYRINDEEVGDEAKVVSDKDDNNENVEDDQDGDDLRTMHLPFLTHDDEIQSYLDDDGDDDDGCDKSHGYDNDEVKGDDYDTNKEHILDELQSRSWKIFPTNQEPQNKLMNVQDPHKQPHKKPHNNQSDNLHSKLNKPQHKNPHQIDKNKHLQQQLLLHRSFSVNDVDPSTNHNEELFHSDLLPTSTIHSSFNYQSEATNSNIKVVNIAVSNPSVINDFNNSKVADDDLSNTSLDSLACYNEGEGSEEEVVDYEEEQEEHDQEHENETNINLDNKTTQHTFNNKKPLNFTENSITTTTTNPSSHHHPPHPSFTHHQPLNAHHHPSILLTNNNMITTLNINERVSDSELIDYEDEEADSLFENLRHDNDDGDDDFIPNNLPNDLYTNTSNRHSQLNNDDLHSDLHNDDISGGNTEDRVRIFMALFTYNPSTMSPNNDADDVELTFKEGQVIKIFGNKDEDGFFMGEVGGLRGLVPCNMVCEVQVANDAVAKHLMMESSRALSASILSAVSSSVQPSLLTGEDDVDEDSCDNDDGEDGGDEEADLYEFYEKGINSSKAVLMQALYDYNPVEHSPNDDIEHELSFRKGDLMEVVGEMDSDGFYCAQLNSKVGMVPSNFITPYEHYHEADQHHHLSPSHHQLNCTNTDV